MNQYSTYSCSWVSYLLSTSVTHWTLGSTYQANGIFWQKKKKKLFFPLLHLLGEFLKSEYCCVLLLPLHQYGKLYQTLWKMAGIHKRYILEISPDRKISTNEARSSKLTLVSFHLPINHVECIMNRPFCPCINPGPLMKPAKSYLSPWCPSAIVSALNTRICHSLTNTCPTSLSILSLWILLFLYDTYNQM